MILSLLNKRTIIAIQMDKVVNKTNESWYPYKELGTYFKLENGVLVGCPMNADGTRDNTPFDIDWERGIEEKEQEKMNSIVSELKEAN